MTLRENAPLLAICALLALTFALLAVFGNAHSPTAPAPSPERPTDAAPLAALPATADATGTTLSQLAPDDAQAMNAQVPFADKNPAAAKPFVFQGNGIDRQRARDCLALAGMAEAGSGDGDQRAVMQVILNRVRHPAFAKTVCGVVFEGSQRPTGCQFTFTCDGSLARTYPEALWSSARRRAEEALGGKVYTPVGTATHYHADYVYPAWSGQLDKIAAVGPHLFFRWRGFWGKPQALSARYRGSEPDPMALRTQAEEVAATTPMPSLAQSGAAVSTISAPQPEDAAPGSTAPGVHFVLVSSADDPVALVDRARALCPGDKYCHVYGWDDPVAIPADLPLSRQARGNLRFSFVAARDGNPEILYYDCRLWPDPAAGKCLPHARP